MLQPIEKKTKNKKLLHFCQPQMAPRKVWVSFRTWRYLHGRRAAMKKSSFPLPLSQRKEAWAVPVAFSLPVVLWSSQVNKLKCSFGSDDSQGGKQQFCLQRDRAPSQEMRVMFPGCTKRTLSCKLQRAKLLPSPGVAGDGPGFGSGRAPVV